LVAVKGVGEGGGLGEEADAVETPVGVGDGLGADAGIINFRGEKQVYREDYGVLR
jgi:hypothetical protein